MSLLAEKLAKQSNDLFNSGLYCSEAILQVFNQELKLGLNENALKIATAFGAGLGGSKDVCGALTGAVLLLSAVKGRVRKEESFAEAFGATQKLVTKFNERFGSTNCGVLTESIKWGEPEHLAYCNRFVAGAVEILTTILNEENE
jgi:C_GCAxxG_C_C family probable redox protein